MRRSLIITVTAAVTMVLLAMLVPMAVLLSSYALEDRLSRAALEVQATETVVSRSADERAPVNVYLDRINNNGNGIETTVLYPDGRALGPDPGEDDRVRQARETGQARVDDVDGGAEVLVPVSLGGTTPAAEQTPVIRIFVENPGLDSEIVRSWGVLLLLGLALLVGALVLADRLGRSFVTPLQALGSYATQLGQRRDLTPIEPSGPREVRSLGEAMNRLVSRIEVLLERERQGVADLSHRLRTPITALRLRVDALDQPADRNRLGSDLDELEAMVDLVIREGRRSQREGLVPQCDGATVLAGRIRFWEPLAEDQGRPFTLEVGVAGPVLVRTSQEDLEAAVDILLDNVFTHTPDDTAVTITVTTPHERGLRLIVQDDGPGFPADLDVVGRGESGAGSTGLGLSIIDKTATESGGGLSWGPGPSGGARIVLDLGGV